MATSARSTPVTPPSPAGHDGTAGTGSTSLVVTVGPSARHYSETSSTTLFGQGFQENNAGELKEELPKITTDFTSQLHSLEQKISQLISEKDMLYEALKSTQEKVHHEITHMQSLQAEVLRLNAEEYKTLCAMVRSGSGLRSEAFMSKSGKLKDTLSNEKGIISKIFEQVGLTTVLTLLNCKELEVQIHAVNKVANLAAKEINQEIIVQEGGLDALLSLLETSENTKIHRGTAVAIANLAINVSNHGLIVSKGGVRLLSNVASKTDDPQSMRIMAGAIANLCGNEKLHVMLKRDGGIKTLLRMFESGHNDVIAQIARGLANFAKCESRATSQGPSLLIEDGVLAWIVANSTMFSPSARRHIELAFCHLAQNEENSRDIIVTGGIKELIRISKESSREDARNLAKKALNSNPAFLKEIQ